MLKNIYKIIHDFPDGIDVDWFLTEMGLQDVFSGERVYSRLVWMPITQLNKLEGRYFTREISRSEHEMLGYIGAVPENLLVNHEHIIGDLIVHPSYTHEDYDAFFRLNGVSRVDIPKPGHLLQLRTPHKTYRLVAMEESSNDWIDLNRDIETSGLPLCIKLAKRVFTQQDMMSEYQSIFLGYTQEDFVSNGGVYETLEELVRSELISQFGIADEKIIQEEMAHCLYA